MNSAQPLNPKTESCEEWHTVMQIPRAGVGPLKEIRYQPNRTARQTLEGKV